MWELWPKSEAGHSVKLLMVWFHPRLKFAPLKLFAPLTCLATQLNCRLIISCLSSPFSGKQQLLDVNLWVARCMALCAKAMRNNFRSLLWAFAGLSRSRFAHGSISR